MRKLVFEHHPAITHIIHEQRECLRAVLEWATRKWRENAERDDTRLAMFDTGGIQGTFMAEFKDGNAMLRLRIDDIEFRPKRISMRQRIAETMMQAMEGKTIAEVTDLKSDIIITRVMYAGMQTHLISQNDPALLDVKEFLS